MAKQATFVMKDSRIDFTAVAAIVVGEVVPIGTGMVGIALTDIAIGASGALITEGCFNMTAKAGEAFAIGDLLYWDDTTNSLTKTTTSNTRAGIAINAKLSADTLAFVRINY